MFDVSGQRRAGIYIKIIPDGIMNSWIPGFQIILSILSYGEEHDYDYDYEHEQEHDRAM
jgi:hypothetical protein